MDWISVLAILFLAFVFVCMICGASEFFETFRALMSSVERKKRDGK
jgi:hypothetical protein